MFTKNVYSQNIPFKEKTFAELYASGFEKIVENMFFHTLTV